MPASSQSELGFDPAVSPLRSRGEGSRSETGGSSSGKNTPLLHYVQLPPYFIGGIVVRIAKGDLHIIRNNQPHYVVLSEARCQELIAYEQEAYYTRVRASLEDLKEGRVKRGTADDLIKELKLVV